jgi:DNA-binding FrmR family transcriptional regulator
MLSCKADVLARLTEIGIHVRGIRTMIGEDRRRAEILGQTCAVDRWMREAGPVGLAEEMMRQILDLFEPSQQRGGRSPRRHPASKDGTPWRP